LQPRLTVTRGGHIAAVCFRLRSPPDLYFATNRILEAHHINMLAHVWAAYTGQSGEILLPGAARTSIDLPQDRRFDYTDHCSQRHPRIEFVGVFDTVVGGAGLAERYQEIRLSSCRVQANVKHAVHSLAIDESRKFFKPVLWTGISDAKKLGFDWQPSTLEQIWMPGVHSDVGRAYGKRHLGNLALQTISTGSSIGHRLVSISNDAANCRLSPEIRSGSTMSSKMRGNFSGRKLERKTPTRRSCCTHSSKLWSTPTSATSPKRIRDPTRSPNLLRRCR
jgi:uncharacterized protein (DUF2235 family)